MISVATYEWTVKPRWQTYGGIVFAVVALLVLLYGILNSFSRPVFLIPTIFAALFFPLALRAVVQGGCVVDSRSRVLRRWWGLWTAIRSVEIPYDAIETVAMGYGLWPGSVRAARDRDVRYHLCVLVDGRPVVVRQGLRDHASAAAIGKELATELDTTFSDGTR